MLGEALMVGLCYFALLILLVHHNNAHSVARYFSLMYCDHHGAQPSFSHNVFIVKQTQLCTSGRAWLAAQRKTHEGEEIDLEQQQLTPRLPIAGR